MNTDENCFEIAEKHYKDLTMQGILLNCNSNDVLTVISVHVSLNGSDKVEREAKDQESI